ncbi:MAG: histidine phosphatase family protein [Proteobacteria bacterium]|nr:histidine phosphatase family protein [Pseudomonadota bacterium]
MKRVDEVTGRIGRRAAQILPLLIVLPLAAVPIAPAGAQMTEAQSLRAVSLLFRHSVISPKYKFPKVDAEWPMGPSQLTAIGMRNLYVAGQDLRKKYVEELKLISPSYHMSEVYFRASNADRALQSAQMLALGLFPLGTGPNPATYDPNLTAVPAPENSYMPVPIHSVALENDKVLRPWTKVAGCVRYRDYVKQFPKSKLYKKIGNEHAAFLKRVASITGVNEGKKAAEILYAINEISEPLHSMVRHSMPLPKGITTADLSKMAELGDWNYHYQFLGKQVGRLTGGPFVEEVLNNFSTYVRTAGKSRRFFLYSGHQRTVLGVDAALGLESFRTKGKLFKGRVPPLGAHYAFELHEPSKGAYAVQVKFVTDGKEKIARIPGCDQDMCPIERFRSAVSDRIAGDWQGECGKS